MAALAGFDRCRRRGREGLGVRVLPIAPWTGDNSAAYLVGVMSTPDNKSSGYRRSVRVLELDRFMRLSEAELRDAIERGDLDPFLSEPEDADDETGTG